MKKLIILLGLAFLIRLIALNQSLWLDEAITANAVTRYSYVEILTKYSLNDFHPPLYYWVTKGWTSVFGTSEIALRMPSVLLSLGTGALVYSLAGFWAAAFLLFNPLFVYYSQEGRMYMLVTFLLTLAYFAIKKNKLALFLFATTLSLLSFYGSLFMLATFLFYLIWHKKYRWAVLSVIVWGALLIILSPLLARQFQNSQIARSIAVNWQQVLGPASLKNVLLIPLKFASGRISFYPKKLYYLLAGGWSLVIWLMAFRKRGESMLFLLVPLALGFVVSFFTPMLSYFRFLYVLPFLVLLIAKNINTNCYKWIILAGFIIWTSVYLLFPQFHREDWKSLSQALPPKAIVYGIPSSLEGVKYYRPDVQIKDIREKISGKKIIVVPYTFEIYGLTSVGFVKPEFRRMEENYRDLVLEVWNQR